MTTTQFLPVVGTLVSGFIGGALAWFATNFWGRPISKFLDLRLQAQETILFHANVGPYLADAQRMPKARDDLAYYPVAASPTRLRSSGRHRAAHRSLEHAHRAVRCQRSS